MAKLSSHLSENNKIHGDQKQIIKRLLGYMLEYKWLTVFAVIFTIIGNLLPMYGPRLAGKAINVIEPGAGKVDFSKIYHYCFLMISFYLTASVFNYILRRIMVRLSQNVIYKLRKEAFQKIAKLHVSYFDSHQTGDILSRFLYDAETLGTYLCQDFITIATSIITVVMAAYMMLVISPTLFLFFCITIPISAFITKLINKKVKPMFRNRTKTLGDLNGFFEETISGHKSIKVYHQEEHIAEQFQQLHELTLSAHYKSECFATMVSPCVNFINNLSLAIICATGSILYLMAQITLGDISSFILYSRKFSGVINDISTISNEMQAALAAAERIFDFIDEKEEEDTAASKPISKVEGNIDFSNVSFGYTKNEQILKNLNLNIKKGQMAAIVGKTGAGKSTLINLMMRFYSVDQGTINLDHQCINDITKESLRRSYSMVLQDTWFFHGTIYENLIYGNPSATKDDVENAAKAAYIHNYITSLKDGYSTILSEDAINISQGQKQLIAIARAMLVGSNILILDEATSNVDTITEAKIQKAMLELMKGKTCFVIAHRLSTIKNADIILVMEQGSIIEKGSHNELLLQKGYYYSLYQSQFVTV